MQDPVLKEIDNQLENIKGSFGEVLVKNIGVLGKIFALFHKEYLKTFEPDYNKEDVDKSSVCSTHKELKSRASTFKKRHTDLK